MDTTLLTGRDLSGDLLLTWRAIQTSNPDLASPYFAPEFTQAVAAVRDDVEIAVVQERGKIAAFFPFQRSAYNLGAPVGGILSDYQGLICRPDFTCDPRELLKKCRLVAWDFDHLLVSQKFFAPFHLNQEPSPLINLSNGFPAYAETCNAVKTEQRKIRRIEREVGPLRFVADATEPALLDQVLAWKSQQYREGGKRDLFALDWTRPLVQHIHAKRAENFAGMLSLLYAGDRLVAGHFGMRSPSVWHYWFPSYDAQMAKYSPGLILVLRMAESAPMLGLRVLDFGKGMSLYKERFRNASVLLASGSVALPSWLSFRRGARRKLRALVANSPLAGPARRLVRRTRGQSVPKEP